MPLPFIRQMHQARPYQIWNKELNNVIREVFWIFLHKLNTISLPESEAELSQSFKSRHYPAPLPPEPAAPYVGGVEWEATHYIYTHLELMNALIAVLPSKDERNGLRADLKASGFEQWMGGSLRTCKEKFYGCVHNGLRAWVGAAMEDGWNAEDVRLGPKAPESSGGQGGAGCFGSPKKSPKKKAPESPPKLELPVLSVACEDKYDGWL